MIKIFTSIKSQLLFGAMLLVTTANFAQEIESETETVNESETIVEQESEEEEEEFKRHKLGAFIGYTWIPKIVDQEGERGKILVPALGFSYEYWFAERWAIGTYNDVEIIKYEVERENGMGELARENAIVLSLGLVYEVLPGWTLIAGGGIETDKNETLGIGHFGTEYVFLEKKETELSLSFTYTRKEFYDTFSIGLVLGKKL
ncbi:hypothetical protein [Galbibacter mesophilus]|uniref:hypothetical protein n=1 Tax=Galbibacter mesophilus TaxID=379069 RepID=UPI00191F9931|nr:hypothetical protein [Galbibacter mesophilus]MCM5661424.1 hypothetical protein [Galbibacter mesophilus]